MTAAYDFRERSVCEHCEQPIEASSPDRAWWHTITDLFKCVGATTYATPAPSADEAAAEAEEIGRENGHTDGYAEGWSDAIDTARDWLEDELRTAAADGTERLTITDIERLIDRALNSAKNG